FTLDYGGGAPELWNALVTHFTTIPGLVGDLAACAGSASASVSWTGAPTTGGPITSYQVTASPGGATLTVPGNATFATFTRLTAGTAHTFTVQCIDRTGPGAAPGARRRRRRPATSAGSTRRHGACSTTTSTSSTRGARRPTSPSSCQGRSRSCCASLPAPRPTRHSRRARSAALSR